MKVGSENRYPPIEKRTSLTIPISCFDRSKGDFKHIIGVVLDVTTDNYYIIGTKNGVLPQLFSRNQIAPCTSSFFQLKFQKAHVLCKQLIANNQNLVDKGLQNVIALKMH